MNDAGFQWLWDYSIMGCETPQLPTLQTSSTSSRSSLLSSQLLSGTIKTLLSGYNYVQSRLLQSCVLKTFYDIYWFLLWCIWTVDLIWNFCWTGRRMEKLRLGTRAGKVKTMGAILCVAGALTISLYKGKSFYIRHHSTHHREISHNVQHNWTRGTVFLVLSVLSYATWFMVQVCTQSNG